MIHDAIQHVVTVRQQTPDAYLKYADEALVIDIKNATRILGGRSVNIALNPGVTGANDDAIASGVNAGTVQTTQPSDVTIPSSSSSHANSDLQHKSTTTSNSLERSSASFSVSQCIESLSPLQLRRGAMKPRRPRVVVSHERRLPVSPIDTSPFSVEYILSTVVGDNENDRKRKRGEREVCGEVRIRAQWCGHCSRTEEKRRAFGGQFDWLRRVGRCCSGGRRLGAWCFNGELRLLEEADHSILRPMGARRCFSSHFCGHQRKKRAL